MGNPSWGSGYHAGKDDGIKQGAAGALLTVAAVAAFGGAVKLISDKVKGRRIDQHETRPSVDAEVDTPIGGGQNVTTHAWPVQQQAANSTQGAAPDER